MGDQQDRGRTRGKAREDEKQETQEPEENNTEEYFPFFNENQVVENDESSEDENQNVQENEDENQNVQENEYEQQNIQDVQSNIIKEEPELSDVSLEENVNPEENPNATSRSEHWPDSKRVSEHFQPVSPEENVSDQERLLPLVANLTVAPDLITTVKNVQQVSSDRQCIITAWKRVQANGATPENELATHQEYNVNGRYLYHITNSRLTLFVPMKCRENVLYAHHDGDTADHLGPEETMA
ncbi:hypothetical protein RN001_006951 [Aquatica leii]|uniref:Uncharacterized protein n=1 Tax=Aquatica leii TaxID=1421715 RepID=A0AAN7PE63_9COLE|nr:hypothetical protein RN001_006951 [Aquatica leii]